MSAQPSAIRLFCVILIHNLKTNRMASFMFLFRGGLEPKNSSPEEMQNNMQKWMSWVDKLKKQGVYKAGEALMPTGKTLRKDNVVTDGPFAESKEIIGGFFIIEAADMKAALDIAQDCPDLPLGGYVEVRDVMVF